MNEEEEKKEELVKEETPEEARAKTINFIIFASILIILFLAIVFVPKFINKTKFEGNKYNNFEFTPVGKFWYTEIQSGNQRSPVPFYYHPSELEDIIIDSTLKEKFLDMKRNNGSIFITLDPDSESNEVVLAGVEISKITGQWYQIPTSSAFIKPPSNAVTESETPIITCRHSSNRTLVVWLTLSNVNLASSEGYCVILEAKTYTDMIRVADRVVYQLLGIMD
ncbi:MAG: hypothetical protein KKF46_02780 [Nanoarchaeota archaeon]|nr:hypothetical protein [Nanoarchaeota archaeon]MBU1321257.1 hypothetical protein [Nanoarchaeota archaeon]MBU1597328.1 hypothetical protein [Nanoarchaeota archaeon]MBU2441451.1 hypothetical protein [Nanoarchaeota archaeon]